MSERTERYIGADIETGKARTHGRPRVPGVDEKVLNAAIDELADVGYQGLTVEKVARRSGVAKATIYRRWPTKNVLLGQAIVMCFPRPSLPDSGSLALDLVALLEEVLLDGSRERTSVWMTLLWGAPTDDEWRDLVVRATAPARLVFAAIVERAIASGECDATVDVELLAEIAVGALLYRIGVGHRAVDRAHIDKVVKLTLNATTNM